MWEALDLSTSSGVEGQGAKNSTEETKKPQTLFSNYIVGESDVIVMTLSHGIKHEDYLVILKN